MAVGVVGVLVPVLPGLLLIAAAALVWAIAEQTTLSWLVFAAMIVVLGIGTIAKYVLPARNLAAAGAPRSTMLAGAVGAVAGFFVIPVVGLLIGGVAGVFLAELRRYGGQRGAAWRSTWLTLKAVGLGILIELAAGFAAVVLWAVALLAR